MRRLYNNDCQQPRSVTKGYQHGSHSARTQTLDEDADARRGYPAAPAAEAAAEKVCAARG